MPSLTPIPDTLDEVIAEIASILAQGYLRQRNSGPVAPEYLENTERVNNYQVFTEESP